MHARNVPLMITKRSLSLLRLIALSATLIVVVGLATPAYPQDPPKSWIDPETGHRVIRLTDEPGSHSFYFNVNAYTPDGRKMAFTTANDGIGVIDLTDFKSRVVVPGPVRVVAVCRKTPRVFFLKPPESALYFANLDTGETGKLADLPERGSVATINADETLVAGTRVLGEDTGRRFVTSDSRGLVQAEDKGAMMARRLAARRPMEMYTVDLKTGKVNVILQGTDWYNHLQFSPTDPTLLMYCHEGSGWRVDRIWTIRTNGTENAMIPDEPTKNRILEGSLPGTSGGVPTGGRSTSICASSRDWSASSRVTTSIPEGTPGTTTNRTKCRFISICRPTGSSSAATAAGRPVAPGSIFSIRCSSRTTRLWAQI